MGSGGVEMGREGKGMKADEQAGVGVDLLGAADGGRPNGEGDRGGGFEHVAGEVVGVEGG